MRLPIDMVMVVLKQGRFWVLTIICLFISISLLVAVPDSISHLCNLYGTLRPNILKGIESEGQPTVAEVENIAQLKEIEKKLHGFFCDQPDFDWAKTITLSVVVSLLVSFGVCSLVPPRPRNINNIPIPVNEDDDSNDKDKVDIELSVALYTLGLDTGNRRQLRAIFVEFRDLAFRAAMIRVAVIYAIGSGLITVLAPPTLLQGSVQNSVQHYLGLILIACASSWWGSQMPGARFASTPISVISMRVGFGGIFLAGFVALVISLPYRLVAATSAAQLTIEQAGSIALTRLALLPLLGLVTSMLTIWLIRRR